MGNVLSLGRSAPSREGFGVASLKKMAHEEKSPPAPPALTVSVVRGGQVGRGAAVDDGVGCQVCKEGQSPHQPCSICQKQHRLRSCQPRAPPARPWGLQLVLEGTQGSVKDSEVLGLTPPD